MNKKWILAGMAALTAMSVLAGCGTQPDKTPTKTNKPLIVGTEPSFPPFEMAENDTYTGFDIDLANAIGEKLGRKVEIKAMGFDALIPALKSGQIDMIASAMSATEERKNGKNKSTSRSLTISAARSSSCRKTIRPFMVGTTSLARP